MLKTGESYTYISLTELWSRTDSTKVPHKTVWNRPLYHFNYCSMYRIWRYKKNFIFLMISIKLLFYYTVTSLSDWLQKKPLLLDVSQSSDFYFNHTFLKCSSCLTVRAIEALNLFRLVESILIKFKTTDYI